MASMNRRSPHIPYSYVFPSSLCQRSQCRSNSLIPNSEVEVLPDGTQVTFGHYAIIYAPPQLPTPGSILPHWFFLLSMPGPNELGYNPPQQCPTQTQSYSPVELAA